MSDQTTHGQVTLKVRTMKSLIADAILVQLQQVKRINYLSFDKVKLLASDFSEYEIPAIQLIDVSETVEHEMGRAKKTWQIALELLLKGGSSGEVSQQDLWDLQYEVERKLWQRNKLNLGIKGVVHLRYLGSSTDLHLLEPYYFSRMDFEVLYYEALVRDC